MKASPNSKTIAGNIRKVREDQNITQEFMASKLFISQNAYSKIELGYTKITVDRLFQIADVLQTEITDLIHKPVKMAVNTL